MPDVFKVTFHKTRRKGVGIIECIILMIIVGVTFGAIFTTMAWSQGSYIFSKQDKVSRELFFSWVQAFESTWSPERKDTDTVKMTKATSAIEAVARALNGTYSGETAYIGSFIVRVSLGSINNGTLPLRINIRSGGKTLVDLERSFNAFSNETVSDDAIQS